MHAFAASLAGQLTLRPGRAEPLRGGRPIVSGEGMRRLAQGRSAARLPELLSAVFALCGRVHRLTAQRAVDAALGLRETPAGAERADRLLRWATARDHLQRLAFDLPARVPHGDPDSAWLHGAPVLQALDEGAFDGQLRQLPRWLEQRLLGMPVTDWLEAWHAEGSRWVTRWAAQQPHPVARWFHAVRPCAEQIAWHGRPLKLLDAPPEQVHTDLRDLAHSLAMDAAFGQRPRWRGLPAETGPWTRRAAQRPVDTAPTVWMRLAARLPDLLCVATREHALRHGALALGDGAAIAWAEMARGLLVHWVQLEPGAHEPARARVAACRVVAPTEWNFHPDGAFARALRSPRWSAADAMLAAAALDPCIEIAVESAAEVSHA